MRLIIRKDAEADIAEGIDWYEQQQTGLGTVFVAEISATLSDVVSAPLHFPLVYRLLRRALLSRFPYGIFFIARTDAVVVVAVMHLARSPERWRARH